MTDQFFPKQFKVKIQNIRLQNLERRKRDVLIQFQVGPNPNPNPNPKPNPKPNPNSNPHPHPTPHQVGVPAERVQEGGLFEEEFASEHVEEAAEVEEGKKGKRKSKPEASTSKVTLT